jgi:hypothetical protein
MAKRLWREYDTIWRVRVERPNSYIIFYGPYATKGTARGVIKMMGRQLQGCEVTIERSTLEWHVDD